MEELYYDIASLLKAKPKEYKRDVWEEICIIAIGCQFIVLFQF